MIWRLGHRPSLDATRGVAILLVLLGHAHLPGFRDGATVGVTLFFVLSGFLITGLLVTERQDTGRVSLPAFYWRRALRLLPALVVVLAVVAGAMVLIGRVADAPGDVLPPLLYSANWVMASGSDLGVLTHTWSLSVEEQFYVIWPAVFLLALWLSRDQLSVALAIAVAGVLASTILRATLWPDGPVTDRVAWGTDTRGDALLLGCAVALACAKGVRVLYPAVFGILALAVIVLMATGLGHPGGGWHLTLIAGAAAVLLWAMDGLPSKWMALVPLVALGQISYGLYLWHKVVNGALRPSLAPYGLAIEAAVLIVLALAIALLSWRYVERPFLRLKRRPPRGLEEHRPRVVQVAE